MRRESSSDRAAWTAHVLGEKPAKKSKYGNKKTEFGGKKYASGWEAEYAATLQLLAAAGKIQNLREQVPVTLVEGRDGVRSIKWIADFTYDDDSGHHWIDTKGYQTEVYRIKKKLAFLLLGIRIEEVHKKLQTPCKRGNLQASKRKGR